MWRSKNRDIVQNMSIDNLKAEVMSVKMTKYLNKISTGQIKKSHLKMAPVAWVRVVISPITCCLLPRSSLQKIIPSQMEVAPLHCTVDITQKRSLSKTTKEIENM